MSRYTAPRVKQMRALGVDLPGLSRKSIQRRPYRPGQHGQARRRKQSDYGRQLLEKQKLRLNYGLSEKQFRRLVSEAKRSRVATGDKLVELLERRLDNAVFRAGLAPTIPAARQLVNHGHIQVNGGRVDIASYRLNVGDTITLREKSKSLAIVETSLAEVVIERPHWLEVDAAEKTVKVGALPDVSSVPFPCDVQLVVEYYAKRL